MLSRRERGGADATVTATVTTDFRHEFEAERTRWLRRRFLWWTGVIIAMGLLTLLGSIAALALGRVETAGAAPTQQVVLHEIFLLASLSLYVLAFRHARRRLLSRDAIIRLVFWLIVVNGVLSLAQNVFGFELGAPVIQRTSSDGSPPPPNFIAIAALGSILLTHFFACVFLPLTPRESIKPVIPLLVLAAGVTVFYASSVATAAMAIAASPLIAAPGAAVCWWRNSRFRNRFHSRVLRRTYGQMKRELTDARRIHEAIFPPPITEGPVRLLYQYEPMRQIGGDFLFIRKGVRTSSNPADHQTLSVVIVDVTGHGVAAALTVNRLSGELERLFGERPDISPGDVLAALNSYVHYTLASHSVYLTALCARVDPSRDALEWASGGHPPAFLRTADGRIDRVDSTAFVLGACHGEDFQHGQRRARFARGDVLIAYTDGAIESRDEQGAMLGLDGFQRLVASLQPDAARGEDWASAILRAVDDRRAGPPEDDTLIVEINRPLEG